MTQVRRDEGAIQSVADAAGLPIEAIVSRQRIRGPPLSVETVAADLTAAAPARVRNAGAAGVSRPLRSVAWRWPRC
jgi:hypothetical protein